LRPKQHLIGSWWLDVIDDGGLAEAIVRSANGARAVLSKIGTRGL
jgi:hypothetical protein